MRIGFDAKRFFHNNTGLGNYSRDLIRILSEYYPEHNYILYNPKKSKKQYSFKLNDVIIEKLPETSFWKRFKSLWRSFGIKKQLVNDEILLYHGLSGEIPLFLPKKIKKVVTIHDLIFIRYPEYYSFFDRKIHTWKFRYAARKADVVIAISEQTKNDIVKYLGINPDKIKVIYQGCAKEFKRNYSEQEKNAVRKKFDLPEKFILNVGTIEKRKNALTIVKSIQNIDTKLVLIGKKTNYFYEIENFIKQNGLEDKIIFLKNISLEELAVIYQLATIFVYPSVFEGFGIPIIEALFSKTPVITTNSGVFPEAGGKDSIYVEPFDAKEMEKQISYLLNNPDYRNEIAENGYDYAQNFTDEAIAKNVMSLYQDVLK